MTGRYVTPGTEGQTQPGSRGRVLANRRGVVRVHDMQVAETAALLQLTDDLLGEITETQRFTAHDLCAWHRRWLGGIYDWAGCRSTAAQGNDYRPLEQVFAAVLRRTQRMATSSFEGADR